MREGRICYQKGKLITMKHMKKIKQFLSNLLFPEKQTYVSMITRVVVVFIFQSFFHLSPFNFQSRPNATVVDFIIIFTVMIPTYAILITFAMAAVGRLGDITDDSTPTHEVIIGYIVLVIAILKYSP